MRCAHRNPHSELQIWMDFTKGSSKGNIHRSLAITPNICLVSSPRCFKSSLTTAQPANKSLNFQKLWRKHMILELIISRSLVVSFHTLVVFFTQRIQIKRVCYKQFMFQRCFPIWAVNYLKQTTRINHKGETLRNQLMEPRINWPKRVSRKYSQWRTLLKLIVLT